LTSDLLRASETADIISRKIWVPVAEESKGFRPWDVGEYAGQTTKEAIPILADYAMHKPGTNVPGGESFDSFRDRFFGALQDAMRQYQGHIGIVTHHRGERLVHAWAAEGFPPDGSIKISEFNKKGEAPGTISEMKIPQD
jgi:broad specificity phosphatase PhoE